MRTDALAWTISTIGSFIALFFSSTPSINYVEESFHQKYVASQVIVRYKEVAERIVIESRENGGRSDQHAQETDPVEEVVGRFEALDEAIGILDQKELQEVELQPKSIKLKQAPDIPPEGESREDPLARVYLVTFQKGTVDEAIQAFLQSSLVTQAQPNFIYRAFLQPNDPYFSNGSLWGMNTIQADKAWDISHGSSQVVVAVVDTGVDYRHSDLAANMWRGVVNGIETYGWDFAANDNDPIDENGHGTHLSGTIGAVGNNATGVVGVSWDVKLMAVRVLDAYGSGTTESISQGIRFAADHGAKVMNLSLGARDITCTTDVGSPEDAITDGALSYAVRTKGVLVVAAAGNDHENAACFYPANDPDVLSVSATDKSDGFSSYSNYGVRSWKSTKIIAAPGGDRSGNTMNCPNDQCIVSTWMNNGYNAIVGTSMATPHVAGVAALVLSKQVMDPFTLRQWLIDTADDIGGDFSGPVNPFLPGDDGLRSYGKRLNAYQALSRLSGGTSTPTPTLITPTPTPTIAPTATPFYTPEPTPTTSVGEPPFPTSEPTIPSEPSPTGQILPPEFPPEKLTPPPFPEVTKPFPLLPPRLRYPPPFIPIPPLLLEMPRDPVAVWMSAIEGEREVILINGEEVQKGTYVSICYNRVAGPYEVMLDRGDGSVLKYSGNAAKPIMFGCLHNNTQRFFPAGDPASVQGVEHRVTLTSSGRTVTFFVRVTL